MKKGLLFALEVLLMTTLLSLGILASETTVCVGGGADAVGTLDAAIQKLDGKGGTIVLCEEITVSGALTLPEQSGDLTITAQNGGALKITASTLTLEKNTNGNTVKFDMPLITGENGMTLYGGFNSVHFGENFSVSGTLDFYGGVAAAKSPSTYKYDDNIEEKLARNTACTTTLPYTVTVDSGDFRVFAGGNYRADYTYLIGSIAAKLDVVIRGGSFNSTVTYGVNDAVKTDAAFSLSGMSFLADEATLTVTGGTFRTPIYAQGFVGQTGSASTIGSRLVLSDAKYYAADGDIAITVTGGDFTDCLEISATQNAPSYNRLLRGNYTVSIGADAILADGIVLDATQVKAYPGVSDKNATLTYPTEKTVTEKRFDVVNGVSQTYDEPLRIACIGDSITQGGGYLMDNATNIRDYANLSYPAQLYKLAVANNRDVIISNYGYSSSRIMDRSGLWYNASLAYVLSREETDANYFIIGLGTNDAYDAGVAAGFAQNYYDGYTAFVQSYAALPCTDMVYGTTATYRNGSDISAVSMIRGMQLDVLTKLAAAGEKVTPVDLYALTLEDALGGRLLSTKDNLHPHTEGYTLYAQAIYNAVLAEEPVTVPADFYMTDVYLASAENGGSFTGKGTLDDPTTELSVAFGKADPKGATIHVIGKYEHTKLSTNLPFNTPYNVENLTFSGYGENAALVLNTKLLHLNNNVAFDNLRLSHLDSTSSALYIACCYHDVTFSETFTTTGSGGALIVAGYLAFNDDDFTATFYTPAESISTNRDCTITVNGGEFAYFLGGNLHYPATATATKAPYGVYSGNMTVNVGKGATIASTVRTSLVGMNYLTGTVTAFLANWADDQVREYSTLTFYSERKAEYDPTKNTGSITVHFLDGFSKPVLRAGDIDKNEKIDFADALLMLKYLFLGTDGNYDSATYFEQTSFTLQDILHMLKRIAK